jgi:hypothetical protein
MAPQEAIAPMMIPFRGSVLLVSLTALTFTAGYAGIRAQAAQTPKPATAPKAAPASPKPAATKPAAAPAGGPATVLQVMRGILYPSSNVVFYAQSEDPTKVPQEKDPSLATNPLASTYGGWEAVSNSAVALSEAVRLLQVPRSCSNGKPAPIQSPTWQKGLTELKAAGQAAYKAAQAKSQDGILDAADKMTTACATCHDKFREKTPRCVG